MLSLLPVLLIVITGMRSAGVDITELFLGLLKFDNSKKASSGASDKG